LKILTKPTILYQFNVVHTDETWVKFLESVKSKGFIDIGEFEIAEGGCK